MYERKTCQRVKAHKKGSNDIDFVDLADYYDYYPDTIFFREDFGANQIMGTRWKMFLKKITAKQSILFSEVVAYLQKRILPYWNNLNH